MAPGKRRRKWQLGAFVVASDLPKSPYTLNRQLPKNCADPLVEMFEPPGLANATS